MTATRRIGARVIRIKERPVSMERVMKMPPNSRIGARIAIVWVICMKDCRL